MKLKENNKRMTEEQKYKMADYAIRLMKEENDGGNVLTIFEDWPGFGVKISFNKVVVPVDILPYVINRFCEKGYFVYHRNSSGYNHYEVHYRKLNSDYYGKYINANNN